ncbi:MAG: hypothetical protein Q7R96_05670 [Nanoarchaeota archaeon]|nr:hypothetical protein [Nanoarchaeota archaeon]
MAGNQGRHDLEKKVVEVPLCYGITHESVMIGSVQVYEKKGLFSGEVMVDPAKEVLVEATMIVTRFFAQAYATQEVRIDTIGGGMLLPGVPYRVKFSGNLSEKVQKMIDSKGTRQAP